MILLTSSIAIFLLLLIWLRRALSILINTSQIILITSDSEEIANIISTLNTNKSSGPNSTPYKISNLLKMTFQNNLQIYLISLFHHVSFHHYSKQQRQYLFTKRIQSYGVSNDRFRSYLSNQQQYVTINGYDSGFTKINCDVPQGSVPGQLLSLLYINDLNQA